MSPAPLPVEARVLPFRRRQAAVRIRRPSALVRLGRPFLQALALVGSPIVLGMWLFSSPGFALADIRIAGTDRLPRVWVEERLAPLLGENLLLLSLAEVEGRLVVSPWVERVVVGKHLPRRLDIEITERTPAALARQGHALWFVDGAGRLIAPHEPRHGAVDLLLLSAAVPGVGELTGALAAAAEFAAASPAWGAGLSEVVVLGDGDFRFVSSALAFPVTARAGTLAERLALLAAWLPELGRRYPALAAVDLRFARRIVFEPVAPPPAAPDSVSGSEGSPAWPNQNST